MTREHWKTRSGFILAAVGSAAGLGNIWRFPWMTAENGGSAFLLLYLLVVGLVSVPAVLGEFIIGRRAQCNPVSALHALSGSRTWRAVGLIFSVGTMIFLLSFYSVVGGWIVRYLADSATGAYYGAPGQHFNAISFRPAAVGFQALFLGVTALIVAGGVQRGIELAAKVMVPAIVAVLMMLAVIAPTLDGAGAGYGFFLGVNWTYLQGNFLAVLGDATGQALFTLSVGAGNMIIYASYLGTDRSLLTDGSVIALVNVLIGVITGLVVFPLLFALGVGPGGHGPGAVFVSLAQAFETLPMGRLVGVVFYTVVLLAALSSAINMLEVIVSFVIDEFGLDRQVTVAGLTVLFLFTGGVNAMEPGVFNFVANTLIDLLLYLGLTAFLLFAAWVLGGRALEELTAGGGTVAQTVAGPWRYWVGAVIPVFLMFTFFSTTASAAGYNVPIHWVGAAAVVSVGAAIGVLSRTNTLQRRELDSVSE
ncbi:MAG: Na+-dependent transporter of the SNF family [halophilic archaeon J07HX5]|nr:MAG: Na+-dependent transporter of the SNF family [halophilic archaeon J07HX5]